MIIEDATKVVSVRKDIRLVRQVRTAGVDEIDAWEAVFLSDCLCSEMFLHGYWIIGASFDRAIICHDHTLHTLHTSHNRNDTASGHIFPRIDLMSSKSRQLQERASSISQGGDSTTQVSLRTLRP